MQFQFCLINIAFKPRPPVVIRFQHLAVFINITHIGFYFTLFFIFRVKYCENHMVGLLKRNQQPKVSILVSEMQAIVYR